MIPDTALIIGIYVIVRMLTTIIREIRENKNNAGIIVAVCIIAIIAVGFLLADIIIASQKINAMGQ